MSHDSRRPPIAVVGLSALFPGSLDETGFWRDILAGRDLMREVPPTHWLVDDYFDPDPSAPDKTYARRGAFLDPVDFDALGFGVPPSIVPATDTSQLLALIVAQRVLEEASQASAIDKDRTSVILGVTSGQEMLASMVSRLQRPVWVKALRESGLPESKVEEACQRIASSYVPWQESSFPGLLGNVVAGRIANRFDLGGTNCVTDAACASAFSAVSMAANELYLGQSDMVITGGVDALNDIFMFMCFSKTPALSRTGDCRPFSDKADGTMLGEGLAMVALKRLEDAEAAGDRIYAVLRGIGSSSDGRAKSVYAPRPEGQAKALRRAYEIAGYGPETVELVEAHGTGTKAGDVAEMEGLRTAFDESGRKDRQWCALGSVKSQIGHTKASAGAAGLFKIVLALNQAALPPTIKVERPNPKLELEKSPFYVNTRARPWIRGSAHPRRASVSAFGFGGSNFHLTLEEYRGPAPRALRKRTLGTELVVMGAETPRALVDALRAVDVGGAGFLRWFARQTQESLPRGAKARVAIVANDEAQLRERLEAAAGAIEKAPEQGFSLPSGIHYGFGPREGGLAFLFPGQGSQYVDMGASVALTWPQALEAWDLAADVLTGSPKLHEVVFPRPAFDDETRAAQANQLRQTEWAQPALGATSLAYLRLLESLGIRPDCVGGHSFGEVVALHVAGAFDASAMLRIARRRGELMAAEAAKSPGAMTAAFATLPEIREAISAFPEVVVANHNAPKQMVLSGPTDVIAKAEEALRAKGIRAERLSVATAFHSPIVAGSSAPFEAFLKETPIAKLRLPVYANSEAAPYPAEPSAIPALLGSQLSHPVRFVEQIEAMYAAGARTFVEVGPGTVLTGLVERILGERPKRAISLDAKGKDGAAAFQEALGKLWSIGFEPAFAELWKDFQPTKDTRHEKRPAVALSITGANYGKPYPPPGGSKDLPKPNPEPQPEPARAAAPAVPHVEPASQPLAAAAVAAPGNQPAVPANAAPWLAAFQQAQREAAEAHAAWQSTMTQAHMAFLQTAERALAEIGSIASGAPATRAAEAESFAMPAMPPIRPAVAPAVAAAIASVPAVAAPAIDRIEAPVQAPAAAATASAASPAPAQDLKALLLSVVAEKTGYPAEMLTLQMGLESDLGIDSIKRVEILSALRARLPNLPDVEPAAMARLRTIGEIVAHLEKNAPATVSPAPASKPNGTSEPNGGAKPEGAPARDLKAILLSVVSEKTGYPAEMLTMQMGLESDLGIDSIKRVEILSALRARVPELPDVEPAAMARLRTLGEIVEHLDKSAPAPAPVSVDKPNGAAKANGASARDLKGTLLSVVAEKTGYPADMLTMQMGLESDLGIDSIKRVEILSALRARVPELPDVEPAAMARLRTLGEIVEHLDKSAPAPAPTSKPNGAAKTNGASGKDLKATLLAVVAEKTGYPADMLTMQMGLESDLGIDSIKRVEILSALRARVPELPDVEPAAMARLRTLGEIVEHLDHRPDEAAATPVKSSASATAPETQKKPAPIERLVVEAVEKPAVGLGMAGLASTHHLAIVGPAPEADALSKALRSRGVVAERCEKIPADADGVVFLGGLQAEASPESCDHAVREAFEAARAIAPRLAHEGGVFVTVQDTGGDFGLSGSERAWLGGIAAIAKTASLEWPKASVKAIDVERAARTPAEIAKAIAAEILEGGPELEVGLRADGKRLTLCAISRALEPGKGAALDESSVVVSTGGARGVSAACLIALAKETHAKFLLLGRTELEEEPKELREAADDAALKHAILRLAAAQGRSIAPAEVGARAHAILAAREVRATLDALKAAGAQARYRAADARSKESLEAALAQTRAEWGPITAIVHAAGVIADQLIEQKTDERFEKVFSTKVHGLRALLQATATDPLRAICLFSSAAARSGNPGQCDYAAANEVMNKVAAFERRRRGGSCLVRAFGWGPWDGGMVGPALKAHFQSQGVPLIALDAGAAAFANEIQHGAGEPAEMVFGAALPAAAAAAPNAHFDMLVTRASHPYLADHTIEGTPVLPVVLALEWFARAAKATHPGLELVACRDVRVLKGARLTHYMNGGDRFMIRCKPTGQNKLTLELRGLDGALFYSASAELSKRPPTEAMPPPDPAPLEKIRGAIYGKELFHGPQFQVIESLDGVGKQGALGTLAGTREQAWTGEWTTDAAALDGGLQLALIWTRHVLGGMPLPAAVGAYQVYRPGLADGPLRCALRGRVVDPSKAICDLSFVAKDGRLVSEMREVEIYCRPDSKRPGAGA